MSARAPELGDGCRPGGSCPQCNARTYYCRDCGDVEVEDKGDRCDGCEPRCCDQCGRPSDGKLCSVACRAAFESDRG
jgi:hypothetical protein